MSEGFTADTPPLPDNLPPSFFRLEAPEIFLLRKTLTKHFRPDNSPSFSKKSDKGGLSAVKPSDVVFDGIFQSRIGRF